MFCSQPIDINTTSCIIKRDGAEARAAIRYTPPPPSPHDTIQRHGCSNDRAHPRLTTQSQGAAAVTIALIQASACERLSGLAACASQRRDGGKYGGTGCMPVNRPGGGNAGGAGRMAVGRHGGGVGGGIGTSRSPLAVAQVPPPHFGVSTTRSPPHFGVPCPSLGLSTLSLRCNSFPSGDSSNFAIFENSLS